MAEFLWTFAVQEVLKKVVKLAAEQIGLAWGLEKELEKLRKWLLKAETIVRYINTKKLHHESVRLWVEDLQQLVLEAEDLLDELVYEDLRRQVEAGTIKKVCNFISPSNNNAFIFRRKMAKEMKNIMDLLFKHYCEASPLGLVGDESTEIEIDLSQLRETVLDLDDFKVVGRDIEVSSIVKRVTDASNQQVTSILSIVGMGGLGKTTLAKLVFNHEMIKGHFDKTIWVCVSHPFLVNKILGAILQILKGTSNSWDNREVLLRELQNEMHDKSYFLVLDDVWNENPSLWDELKCCLMRINEKPGNFVIVTTRSTEVAKIMETIPSHHLSKLSDDHCWSLFKKSANINELPITSNLEDVQEELVKKIGGIPLVARVLGRTTIFRGDYERWVTILKSVLRTPLQDENCVLSILKLSVDHLPSSSLKQCFAYCSNFSKDFKFRKEQLIQMWMAQGFIQPQEGRSHLTMEDIGDMYFNILLSRCLFQDVVKDDRGRITSCKMHDLVHDIACVVSKEQKLQSDPNLLDKKIWMNGSEAVASKLRTMVCYKVISNKIVNFVCLRVLIMNSRNIKKLPNSVGKLKHLRYLDISHCSIKKLPESITLLYNLQTLRIGNSLVKVLPKNIRKLVSLRHFEFSVSPLNNIKQMPPHLSQLTQLQTLSNFVAGYEKGCKISELGPLKNLKGSLRLSNLKQVKSKEEAKAAKLVDKENLHELKFQWSLPYRKKDNHHNDLEVLEGLQPHKNLQSFSIEFFPGKCLPNNIFVENLVAIYLFMCENCEMLPMLGQLSNLEILTITHLPGVRSIGNEFYGNDPNQRTFFPKLKKFELTWMTNLERWEEITVASNVVTFPRLRDLYINSCRILSNIPNLFGNSCDENGDKHLRIVSIYYCSQLSELPSGLQFCDSIKSFNLGECPILTPNLQNKHMSFLNLWYLQKFPDQLTHLTSLKHMEISGRMQNYDLSPLVHLRSLTRLKLVDDSSNVTQLPQQLEYLTALQTLSIQNFDGIKVLPEWLGNLVSLQTLHLSSCKKLKQLPSREAMLRLTRLCVLRVYDCPQLQLGEGDSERAKLSNLPVLGVHVNDNLNLMYFRFSR